MEVIAGPDDGNYEVSLREGGHKFLLDFKTVYWNSKLQHEHSRVVDSVIARGARGRHLVVADVMAGIGPFAVPLASSGNVTVHANDLNPDSFKYLKKNVNGNKGCKQDRVFAYNMDGRQFVHALSDKEVDVDYFVLNLPQIAVEFLDAFRGTRYSASKVFVSIEFMATLTTS